MRSAIMCLSALLSAMAADGATHESFGQTKFGIKQILINSSPLVYTFALNNKSQIAGAYHKSNKGFGFLYHAGTVTQVPAPCASPKRPWDCVAIPTATSGARLLVAGFYTESTNGNTYGFTYHEGDAAISNSFYLLNNSIFKNGLIRQPLMNSNGLVAFNTYTSGTNNGVQFGQPSAPKPVAGLEQATVESLNATGVLAGIGPSNGATAIFYGTPSSINYLLPTGATQALSARINDLGELAGSYLDSSGLAHGVIESNGTTTTFEMPKAATMVTIDDINNKGRVIGHYTTTKGNDFAFLYNGTTVTAINIPGASQAPLFQGEINSQGEMVFVRYSYNKFAQMSSYRVLCSGTGC